MKMFSAEVARVRISTKTPVEIGGQCVVGIGSGPRYRLICLRSLDLFCPSVQQSSFLK